MYIAVSDEGAAVRERLSKNRRTWLNVDRPSERARCDKTCRICVIVAPGTLSVILETSIATDAIKIWDRLSTPVET